jgi:hypothetical protein
LDEKYKLVAHGTGGESGSHDFGFMALVVDAGLEKSTDPKERGEAKERD